MKKILFLPIDNRPITYSLTGEIAALHKSLNLVMPKRELLGGLYNPADIEELLNWLENEREADLIILSLDTLAYGGLVPSRRGRETFEEIKERVEKLYKILALKKKGNPNLKIYATSSIMRISNNNINEEEKEYWNIWGKKIFSYSYHQHKSRRLREYNCVYNIIPEDILNDYLDTRKRNFEINRLYLNWLKEGVLDFLVYSKDDTGEFGLNVEEAEKLEEELRSLKLNGIIKTGADEIPLGLFLRGVAGQKNLKIKPVFSYPASAGKISRYEDLSVKDCAEAQIKLGGGTVEPENPDIILYINNFEEKQGDLVFQDVVNSSNKPLPEFGAPFIVADINNANGADNGFIKQIMQKGLTPEFLGYSGYNTSANSIGSALCIGVISYLAKKEGVFDEFAFKKLLVTRLLDDWAYQANLRIKVQTAENKEEALLETDFSLFEKRVKEYTGLEFEVKYSLPWKRSFELETEVNYGN